MILPSKQIKYRIYVDTRNFINYSINNKCNITTSNDKREVPDAAGEENRWAV